jgi:D-proline reductase (dithiol) PrdB
VCAISYYLERQGIMTTGISLVRENAASMRPPRSLWVPFALGRPLGKPNDTKFQHRVITAALSLLSAQQGPVLEDYAEQAPAPTGDEAAACPVSFSRPEDKATSWQQRLVAEVNSLRPWHNLGKRRRNGRTLTGVSNTPVDEIVQRLGNYVDTSTLPLDNLTWIKHATEDAKTFYIEAMTAQPGAYNPDTIQEQFWRETILAQALVLLADKLSSQSGLAGFARILVPRSAIDLPAKSTKNHDDH